MPHAPIFEGNALSSRSPSKPIAARQPSHRRRGSAILLVITVLGILFVTGVAFLATINFDSQMLALEQEATRDDITVGQVTSRVNQTIRNSLVAAPGVPTGAKPMGTMVDALNDMGLPSGLMAFRAEPGSWVELPLVHGLFSQIEPYAPNPADRTWMIYSYFTDMDTVLASQPSDGSVYENFRHVDTRAANLSLMDEDTYRLSVWPRPTDDYETVDADRPYVADADGDGIVDSILVGLSKLGFPRDQIDDLARAVNTPDYRPQQPGDDRVYLALRIIPHGGLLNLSEAHPNLIDNLMVGPRDVWTAQRWQDRKIPYSPQTEERFLRNRGGVVPPRLLPPTQIQGNPFDRLQLAPPGGGHFAAMLFPANRVEIESALTGGHRFHPFSSIDQDDVDYDLWVGRMDPYDTYGRYDYRHLVTSVSYDHLLARPVAVDGVDAFQRMIDANKKAVSDAIASGFEACDADLPFDFPNYPPTIRNGPYNEAWCACYATQLIPGTTPCEMDPRKGRMRLSLPWLDEAYRPNGDDDADLATIGPLQRTSLIQEAFTMMLLNADGADWASYNDTTHTWEKNGEAISRTAAALTANLLDFADRDSIPTRVELRSADFAGDRPGQAYSTDVTKPEYVYGIERQPFITAVALKFNRTAAEVPQFDYAVELYNPYDTPIALQQPAARYSIRHRNKAIFDIALSSVVQPGERLVWMNADGAIPSDGPKEVPSPAAEPIPHPDTIYLVLSTEYEGVPTDIVLDQFLVPLGYAKTKEGEEPTPGAPARAAARLIDSDLDPRDPNRNWFVTVPVTSELDPGFKLGQSHEAAGLGRRPVQVLLADNLSTTADPVELETRPLSHAFKTTGSLLLLMRYANRAISDAASEDVDNLAFTTYLATHPEDVENGHMPVFDAFAPGESPRNHVDPNSKALTYDASRADLRAVLPKNQPGDVANLPWGQLVFDYFTTLPLFSPSPWANPNGLSDEAFFAQQQAKPPRVELDGLRVHGRVDLNAAPQRVLSGLPYIPMAQLPDRPSRPNSDPNNVRELVRTALGFNPSDDDLARVIGNDLAESIVAYRELRSVGNSGDFGFDAAASAAGHYARGWNPVNPGPDGLRLTGDDVFKDAGPDLIRGTPDDLPFEATARRGTGFLSVGELANVRHPAAMAAPSFRIDNGELEKSNDWERDYLSAAARLIALSDWVTVRSDVYTVYGSFWGDVKSNQTREELESRALRFMETVDRLPTFLGAPSPARIGERVMAKYNDLYAD